MQGAVVPEAACSSVPVTSASGDASDSTCVHRATFSRPQDIPHHSYNPIFNGLALKIAGKHLRAGALAW